MFPRTLLAALLALALPASASAATYVVEPGQKIQDAVAKAADGDTIEVRTGTYTEKVTADDNITIAASPGTLLVAPADSTGPALSLGDGGTVTGLGVVSFVGDAVSVGPGATLIQRSGFITVAKDAAALSATATGSQVARTITVDSSVLFGASALSTTVPQSVGQPGMITVDARHVTAIGRIVANASAATPGAGGVAVTFADSIIRGTREAAGRAATTAGGITITPAVPATITADPARNSVADAVESPSPFARPSQADFHLRADASSLMDKGQITAGESSTDIDGQPRTTGSASDYGADEFVNRAPIARLDGPAEVREGRPVTFDASASSDPDEGIGGGITRYRWDFGDGTTEETTVPTVTHAFAERRSHSVRVTVFDRNGASAESDAATFTVLDGSAPSVAISQPGTNQRLPLYTKTKKRRKVTFFGTAKDDTGVTNVFLALRPAASKDGTCRWFNGKRKLVAASCATPTIIAARLGADGSWRYALPRKARLPRGAYLLTVASRDASGLTSAAITTAFRFK